MLYNNTSQIINPTQKFHIKMCFTSQPTPAMLPLYSKGKPFKMKYQALTHHDKNLKEKEEKQNEACDKTFKVTIIQ